MDLDLTADFEVHPSKKARVEAPQSEISVPEPQDVVDDMDDLYGTPPAAPASPIENAPILVVDQPSALSVASSSTFQLPGLGLKGNLAPDQLSSNASNFTRPYPDTKEKELSPLQTTVECSHNVQQEQRTPSEEERGTRVENILHSNIALSDLQPGGANTTETGNSKNFGDVSGLGPEVSKATVSGENGGTQAPESESGTTLSPQPVKPQVQGNIEKNGSLLQQEPMPDTTDAMEINHERVEDSQGATGVQQIPLAADCTADTVPIQCITTVSLALNPAQTPSGGEQSLKTDADTSTAIKKAVEAGTASGEPEFEIDSSPIGSSSSDTSSDSSSSDDSDDDYQMLDPEEEARRLMAEDVGSDGEGGNKGGKGAGNGHVRTLNEKPDDVVEKPNVAVTTDMIIEELGYVENLVDNLVLIKAKTSGEYQVLETGSVLCLEDRTVIGVIAETLGRVQQPFYSVRFTNAAAINEIGISTNTKIFYVPQHSYYAFTQAIKAIKGSDASNLHDEEVGDDEIEFSDDEAEVEHKRRVKMQRQSKREARTGAVDGFSRGPRQGGRGNRGNRGGNGFQDRNVQDRVRDFNVQHGDTGTINYDDPKSDGDELYTPLARPSNLHEMMGHREAPLEGAAVTEINFTGGRGNRGRGDRGRGGRDRGGGRGDRGRGRGGRGNGRDGGGFDRNRNGDRQAQRSFSPPHQSNGFHSPPQVKLENPSYPHYNGYHAPSPPQNNAFAPPASYPSQASPYTTPSYQPPAQTHTQPHATPSYNPPAQPYPQPHNPSTQYNTYAPGHSQSEYWAPQNYASHSYPQQQQQMQPPQQYYQPQPYQSQSQYPQPQQYNSPPPPSNIPPGAHVNPAFYANANPFGGAGSPP